MPSHPNSSAVRLASNSSASMSGLKTGIFSSPIDSSSSCRLAQQVNVLLERGMFAAGNKVDDGEVLRELFVHVARGVKHGAEVGTRLLLLSDHELPAAELLEFVRRQRPDIMFAVGREPNVAAGFEHTQQFVDPEKLQRFAEVCKNRERVNEIKGLGVVRQFAGKPVDAKLRKRQVALAPVD